MTTELLVFTKVVTLPFAGIDLSTICSEHRIVLNSLLKTRTHGNMLPMLHKHNILQYLNWPPEGNKKILNGHRCHIDPCVFIN